MAARDRYTWTIKCPLCGEPGTAQVSEEGHPYVRRLDRAVDSITEGFTVTSVSDRHGGTVISCRCGGKITK